MLQTWGSLGQGKGLCAPRASRGICTHQSPQSLSLTCERVSAESQTPLLRRQLRGRAGAERSHGLGACEGLGENRDRGEGTEENPHSLGADSGEGSWTRCPSLEVPTRSAPLATSSVAPEPCATSLCPKMVG